MPRGNIPRQPSKAGRQDRVQRPAAAMRLAGKATLPTRPKASLEQVPKKRQPAGSAKSKTSGGAAPKGYNPIAPQRVNEILGRIDERYPNVTCALHHNSAW